MISNYIDTGRSPAPDKVSRFDELKQNHVNQNQTTHDN